MQLGKHLVPKGTDIFINIAMVHLNPSLYPRPYEFNPENFNAENMAKRPQYSYLPFSAGARNCLGKPPEGVKDVISVTQHE